MLFCWRISILTVIFITLLKRSKSEECRCLPHEPCWPTIEEWNSLNQTVGGHLSIPFSPVDDCLDGRWEDNPEACDESLRKLGADPFYLQTLAGGTESTGQTRAWTAMPSKYAIEARNEADIAAGVVFAQKHNLRLVVKGTGHDYYGRSSSADSLLIWTHLMRNIEFHDSFIPQGCEEIEGKWKDGISAVTLEAGLTWMDVYAAASIDRDLYVQGGGCTSVGVVGWHIGGGYGSFSKRFGTGPANMLEAKLVTSTGEILTVNECQNTDLFYAIRGGGYGFGVIVSLTVRTHPIPKTLGFSIGNIKSRNNETTLNLIEKFLEFYRDELNPIDWGEQVGIRKDGLEFTLLTLDLSKEELELALKPFKDWVLERPNDYSYDVNSLSFPFKVFWDSSIEIDIGNGQPSPYDPKEPERAYFWNENVGEISAFWLGYYSRFLMNSHFMENTNRGAKILHNLAKVFDFNIHFNKAQYGASQWAVDELDNTPMHPTVKTSFGLMIMANNVKHYSPLVPNHLQNKTSNVNDFIAYCDTDKLDECWAIDEYNEQMRNFRAETPGAGAYFNEADYFEPNWQETFWGKENYDRLYDIKKTWDPNGIFYCHNCVGSEDWKEGGMCKN